MKRYKVFDKGLISPFQNFQYEVKKQYICDNFDTNKNEECSNGFYATKIDGITYSWNSSSQKEIWLVEVGGEKVEINQYKMRYEKIKLIRKCTKKEIIEEAKKVEEKIGYKLSSVLYPKNPLKGKAKKVTKKDIENLKKWDSVKDSVWNSVRASVGDSVKDSVWASVRDSVWNSVGALISSLFLNIKEWKYIYHKKGENPFQPGIDLWNRGFIPSYDGQTWRLHSGKNAEIVYEENKK